MGELTKKKIGKKEKKVWHQPNIIHQPTDAGGCAQNPLKIPFLQVFSLVFDRKIWPKNIFDVQNSATLSS